MSKMALAFTSSRALVGSSANMKDGFVLKVRSIDKRWSSPTEHSLGFDCSK